MESLFYTQQIEKSDPTNISVDKFISQLDRALTQEPYSLVSTITSASEFLRQHPFPEVLNRLFNILAKVFGDKTSIPETKVILFRIVQLTRECKPFIHAYQTSDVMLRVIMMVSHNLDPEIRALCLMLLEGLAAVVCEDSHAQHLIIEGLSAPTVIEKTAAIVAVKEFVEYSKQFCELVIQKFEDLLFSTEITSSLKVKLINILPHFRDGVTLCDRIYSLGKRLLAESLQKEVTLAAYDLLTHVAAKGIQVGDHADFLMDTIIEYKNEPIIVQRLFKNLYEISTSTHWEKEQIQRFLSFYPLCQKQKSSTALYYFLKALTVFTTESRFVKEIKSMDNNLVALLCHSNFSISVEAARIVVNLQDFDTSTSTLINLLPNVIQRLSDSKPKEQKVFCKVIVDYCRSKSTTDDDVRFIIGQLINSTTANSSSFKIVLETLNSVCAQFPKIYPIAIHFAQNILDKEIVEIQTKEDIEMDQGFLSTFNPNMHLFSLLLAPEFARGSTTTTPLLALEDIVHDYGMKLNYSIRYNIAVMAFRYGHWREIALPLLQSLPLGKLQSTFSSWIKCLIHLAKSQPAAFSAKDLSLSQMQMKAAQITAQNLTNVCDKGKFFKFPYACIEIFNDIIYLLHSYLVLITVNRMTLNNEHEYAKRGIAAQCKLYSARSAAALNKLDILLQRSFDVDNESRAQLFLLQQFLDLIHFSLGFFCLSPPSRMPPPFFVETNSPTNAHLLELISWARSQFSKLYEIEKETWKIRITETNVYFVKDILFKLFTNSFYLPRSFFNFIYTTKIRLNIKSEGKETSDHGRYLVSGAAAFHPIMVEGYVETNNPAGIQAVIIHGSIAPYAKVDTEQFKLIHQRAAELPNDINHFALHFTFNVNQTSSIRFEASFIDKTTKKTWQSNTVEEIIIQIGGS
uniref:Integrator complex subunit 7 n=1 Tax=Panagrolaimus sp. PS1159 TaxID=55785 RepID=A0AC35F5E0_9BILA